MRLDKLPFTVFNTIKKYRLIEPHDSVIIAVSGGPDSVSLLKTLSIINSAKNLRLRLLIAHLNHQLRGTSSEEDEQFVRNLSKDLSLPFIVKRVDIKKVADETKHSVEETARMERYKFFMESAKEHRASAVAVGHTADDNIETLLHRIIRGTGTLGLGGIPLKRPLATDSSVQLVRPLLFSWRKDIIEYLGKEHGNYRTDDSNYEPVYLRNKIRLELIPLLENHYNPNIKGLLMQLCQILCRNNEYVLSEAKKIAKATTVEERKDAYTVNTHFLAKQPEILQYLALREILITMHVPLKEISYEHYTRMLDELTRKGKGRQFPLPGKLYLWHEHGMLHFKKEPHRKPCIPLSEVVVQIPGTTPLYPLGHITSEILDTQDFSLETYKKTKTRYEEVFDLQRVTMPLSVRGRRDGDTISPLGITGHKKLKDLFIDNKIPRKERDAIPLVVMNDRPVWVVGICTDNEVKVTPGTKKILKLTFHSVP